MTVVLEGDGTRACDVFKLRAEPVRLMDFAVILVRNLDILVTSAGVRQTGRGKDGRENSLDWGADTT